jgi:1-acyl-sn-glycerol-3-phosphate acyltransferase
MKDEGNPNAKMTKAAADVPPLGFRHSFVIRRPTFDIHSVFHSLANRTACVLAKALFACIGPVRVVRRETAEQAGGFLLAANHISHFDPVIISSAVRRKIDWMAMAEFFPHPLLGRFLKAIDAFPADRHRADRKTIRTAMERLKQERIVGIFPEGGIRDGARSVLEGAPLRPGASTLAHMASVPILPCVIIGTDRFYSAKSWLRWRRTPIWIAFGEPISHFSELQKSDARECIERDLAAAFKNLYSELRETFRLTDDDLPRPPRERMRKSTGHPERSRGIPKRYLHVSPRDSSTSLRSAQNDSSVPVHPRRGKTKSNALQRFAAVGVDGLMCASMNLLQSRHRLHAGSRDEMERYVTECETLTAHEYYAAPHDVDLESAIGSANGTALTWRSPIETKFAQNNVAHADFFRCPGGWDDAPTVLMLHALMSASDIGYRRWAAHFNELGWNVCFVHLPYHYSRVPRGYWNGELAITADLIRNAEGLRQGVMEVRQLIAAMRARGCQKFGILGTSYGGWIGALLAMVETDLRFVALMAPIVNAEHAIWENPTAAFMRRELRRAKIDPPLVARHFHLSSPLHNEPLCSADRVLFVAGEFDLIARSADIEAIHQKWRGSELLRVRQGHFGYRMMRETIARLKERGL